MDESLNKAMIYVTLVLSLIFFSYAIVTFIVNNYSERTMLLAIFRGGIGSFFGYFFLRITKNKLEKQLRIFRVVIWIFTILTTLYFLFVIYLYIVF